MESARSSEPFPETDEIEREFGDTRRRVIVESARLIVEEEMSRIPPGSNPLSEELRLQKKEGELSELLEVASAAIAERISRAFHLIVERFPHVATPEETVEFQNYLRRYEKLQTLSEEEMQQKLEQAATLQEAFEIPSSLMLTVYLIGLTLFEEKAYEDSYSVMTLLAYLNPDVPAFWTSQGCALYCLERPAEAVQAYASAILIDPNDPQTRAYSIQAYLKEGKKGDAALEYSELRRIIDEKSELKEYWQEFLNEVEVELGGATI